jgi:hypothetical protein
LSIANAGENNPMYGKKASEETRLKQSKALSGRSISLETREKISITSTGKPHSLDRKNKISATKQEKLAASKFLSIAYQKTDAIDRMFYRYCMGQPLSNKLSI